MKPPDACGSLAEIREAIDTIDRHVIALLGQRFGYVKAAAQFKTTDAAVRVLERFQVMLTQRRAWATDEGLNPDAIAQLYRDLVNYFIDEERKHWQAQATRDQAQ